MLGIGNDLVIAFSLITVTIADNGFVKSRGLQGGCNNISRLHAFF